jgi:hypothetical protein
MEALGRPALTHDLAKLASLCVVARIQQDNGVDFSVEEVADGRYVAHQLRNLSSAFEGASVDRLELDQEGHGGAEELPKMAKLLRVYAEEIEERLPPTT